jgi:hypothetical protein
VRNELVPSNPSYASQFNEHSEIHGKSTLHGYNRTVPSSRQPLQGQSDFVIWRVAVDYNASESPAATPSGLLSMDMDHLVPGKVCCRPLKESHVSPGLADTDANTSVSIAQIRIMSIITIDHASLTSQRN